MKNLISKKEGEIKITHQKPAWLKHQNFKIPTDTIRGNQQPINEYNLQLEHKEKLANKKFEPSKIADGLPKPKMFKKIADDLAVKMATDAGLTNVTNAEQFMTILKNEMGVK